MFRAAAVLFFMLASLGLGLGATFWTVRRGVDIGVLRSGPWVANMRAANDPDPYTRAHLATTGEVALALAEGIRLRATTDDERRPLNGRCRYSISGNTPQARYWTLSVTDRAGDNLENPLHRNGFTSSEVLRDENGAWRILLSNTAEAGNWQPLPAEGAFVLVLHLYEPAILGGTGAIERDRLPRITREGC